MTDLFVRNRRLLILAISLIVVAGASAYQVLPRMEDPLLTRRFAILHTQLPGADPERVESLVTEKLEDVLREIEEIRETRSSSRTGISTITVELRDDVYESEPIWSQVRDKLDDATDQLPAGALPPEFEELEVRAYALLVALTWNHPDTANYAILRRLAEQLKDELKQISGTDDVDLFGDPQEEIVATVDPAKLASLGLTAADVARQLAASDAKVAAGHFRGTRSDLLLEVDGELDSLARVARTPVHFGAEGQVVQVGDLADLSKSFAQPPSDLALVGGRPAVVLGMLVHPQRRIDTWSKSASGVLEAFADGLPAGVELETMFRQDQYVGRRLNKLLGNLATGGLAVVGVIFVLMGWRNALVVGAALPLSALMVLAGLRVLEIPIHQMSITGLILALGLLIDNAIVVVDEVSTRRRQGQGAAAAVSHSVRHLAVPLFGSTLTTALAFAPIALMEGPAGEFVGSIAVSVILAISSSFVLAMTIVPTLSAMLRHEGGKGGNGPWWRDGIHLPALRSAYDRSLAFILARPVWGIGLGAVLPLLGFVLSQQLSEQFFPAADRDQFHIEMELPANASLRETTRLATAVRARLMQHPRVRDVHWFLGASAPSFYYNVVQRRNNTAFYAQALVQLDSDRETSQLIRQLQERMDRTFPQARLLLRQLEQGPPFEAPIEVRLFGPDIDRLYELGERVRGVLAGTPGVIHTRAELNQTLTKMELSVDEEQARLAGLDHTRLAEQLDAALEGVVGGSVLESTEELPVRVRMADEQRGDWRQVASLDVLPGRLAGGIRHDPGSHPGMPLSAIAGIRVVPELAAVPRLNSVRMNELQAFITAGELPDKVLRRFQQRLLESGWEVPPGYTLRYGGEAAKRDDAVGNLMASVGVLLVLMVATLVLSFGSFRLAALIAAVAFLAVGLGLGGLWLFGYPFGFMAIVGTMGLVGVAINDAIVVLAGLRSDPRARKGDPTAMHAVVMRSTRHVVATSLTTMAGFTPLVLAGGGFWPPLAVTIAGGVSGATLLALYFVPAGYRLLMPSALQPGTADRRRRPDFAAETPSGQPLSASPASSTPVGV